MNRPQNDFAYKSEDEHLFSAVVDFVDVSDALGFLTRNSFSYHCVQTCDIELSWIKVLDPIFIDIIVKLLHMIRLINIVCEKY